MIADILEEATAEIRRCQQDMPHAYDYMRADIDVVLAAMDALRAKFDGQPSNLSHYE